MLRPEVRYARAEDGVTIAYSVVGAGPVTIVVVSPLISQLELAWEEPALEHFWSRFAACAQVVLFDRRGAGLSDPPPAGERAGLAALALDIEAVLDACGARQAALFGVTFGCPVAVGFAASHPDRVQALVLAGGFAKLTRLGGFDFEADPDQVGEWASSTARAWGSGEVFGARAPSMADKARYREWAARMERHTCSPGSVEALCRWAATIDVRPLLAGLRLPVLVIHRRGDTAVPASDGRYLAEHIPGAEYVELPGADHTLFAGDQRAVHAAVIGFLDGAVAGLVSAGRRGDAVELYQTQAVGLPHEVVAQLRHAPFRPGLEAIAHTLAYDAAIIGDRSLPAGLLAGVTVPALVITGEQSPPFLRNAAQAAAQTMPHGRLAVLPGQTHDLNPGATAPVMAEFLA